MPVVLLVLLVGIPVLELVVAVQVAHAIGVGLTLLLLVGLSVLGAFLLRRQGAAAFRAVRASRGASAPATDVVHGAIAFVGALLVLLPGFVTAAVGLVLLTPVGQLATRRLFTVLVLRRVGAPVVVAAGAARQARRFQSGRRTAEARESGQADHPVVVGEVLARSDTTGPGPDSAGSMRVPGR